MSEIGTCDSCGRENSHLVFKCKKCGRKLCLEECQELAELEKGLCLWCTKSIVEYKEGD
jgi:uncharacterized membrane protein YvbJ